MRSRWVTATGGLIMVALNYSKMSALVEAVPVVVLGGAGIVMFGMVTATGARILTGVDFKTNRYNLFVVAIAVGFGMIPLVAPNFFQYARSATGRCWNRASCWRRSFRCCSISSPTALLKPKQPLKRLRRRPEHRSTLSPRADAC